MQNRIKAKLLNLQNLFTRATPAICFLIYFGADICRSLNINFDKKLKLKIKAAGTDRITPSPVDCAPNKLISKPQALDQLDQYDVRHHILTHTQRHFLSCWLTLHQNMLSATGYSNTS